MQMWKKNPPCAMETKGLTYFFKSVEIVIFSKLFKVLPEVFLKETLFNRKDSTFQYNFITCCIILLTKVDYAFIFFLAKKIVRKYFLSTISNYERY